MDERYPKHVLTILFGFIIFMFIVFSIQGCDVIKEFKFDYDVEHNPMIIGGDTAFYQSVDDSDYFETLGVETMVVLTGRCRESAAVPGEIRCPIRTVYTSKEGWVIKESLLKFEDYLP
jgi:hypothetical protein